MSTSMLMLLGTIFAFFLVRNQTLPPVSRIAIVYPVPTDTIDIWYLTHPFDTMYRWTSLSAAVVRFVQFCYCSTCSALSFFTSFTSSIILLLLSPLFFVLPPHPLFSAPFELDKGTTLWARAASWLLLSSFMFVHVWWPIMYFTMPADRCYLYRWGSGSSGFICYAFVRWTSAVW